MRDERHLAHVGAQKVDDAFGQPAEELVSGEAGVGLACLHAAADQRGERFGRERLQENRDVAQMLGDEFRVEARDESVGDGARRQFFRERHDRLRRQVKVEQHQIEMFGRGDETFRRTEVGRRPDHLRTERQQVLPQVVRHEEVILDQKNAHALRWLTFLVRLARHGPTNFRFRTDRF